MVVMTEVSGGRGVSLSSVAYKRLGLQTSSLEQQKQGFICLGWGGRDEGFCDPGLG